MPSPETSHSERGQVCPGSKVAFLGSSRCVACDSVTTTAILWHKAVTMSNHKAKRPSGNSTESVS